MAETTISDDRARGIRRLLYVILGFAVVLVLLAALLVGNDYGRYGALVLLIAVILGAAASLCLRALKEHSSNARRACILTGVLLLLLSVPLVPIGIGLLTAVTSIGVLIVVLAPEHPAS